MVPLILGCTWLVNLVYGNIFYKFDPCHCSVATHLHVQLTLEYLILNLQACTLFNSEMAPAHLRGGLNVLFQLSVTIGILVAQLINYGTQHIYFGWRIR